MPTTRLEEMKQDIDEATLQLEQISQMLRSHAIFLRSKNLDHFVVDILLVENQVDALTLSIEDLKGATVKVAQPERLGSDLLLP